jgi:hypothetical protein
MDECVHPVSRGNTFSLAIHACYLSHSRFDPVDGFRIERNARADTPVDQAWNSAMFWIHVAEDPNLRECAKREDVPPHTQSAVIG